MCVYTTPFLRMISAILLKKNVQTDTLEDITNGFALYFIGILSVIGWLKNL